MKLISWNVNGMRAAVGKGLMEWIPTVESDILCFQETKAQPDQLDDLPWPEGYHRYVYSAAKKGYSGTAVLTRIKPLRVWNGLGLEEHDQEGRVQNLEFDAFTLVNVYTPNAQNALARLDYRLEWDAAFLKHLCALREQSLFFSAETQCSHQEIDLARPKKCQNPGFSPEERLLSIDRCGFHRHLSRLRAGRRPLLVVELSGRGSCPECGLADRLLRDIRLSGIQAPFCLHPP